MALSATKSFVQNCVVEDLNSFPDQICHLIWTHTHPGRPDLTTVTPGVPIRAPKWSKYPQIQNYRSSNYTEGKCSQIFKILHSFWVISKKLKKGGSTFASATSCLFKESLPKSNTQKLSNVPKCVQIFIKIGWVVSEKLALQKRLGGLGWVI